MIFSDVKANVNNILNQITSAKCRGRRFIKVKVYQLDFTGGKPHGLYMLSGMSEGGEGEKALKELGYEVLYEKNDKQISTGYDMKGAINKCVSRDLHTTTMIVRW